MRPKSKGETKPIVLSLRITMQENELLNKMARNKRGDKTKIIRELIFKGISRA